MQTLDAIILGTVQGLTEFLPVSSSGHLALGQGILGAHSTDQPLFFSLWVHAATLAAVMLFYRQDVANMLMAVVDPRRWRCAAPPAGDAAAPVAEQPVQGMHLIICLVVATIPVGVAGLLFKKSIEALVSSPVAVSVLLIVTGCILLLSRFEPREKRRLSIPLALAVGCAQVLALPPGISRAGTTITAGLLLGLPREEAARLSFLMSIPAIMGAVVLEILKEGIPPAVGAGTLIGGGLTAFLAGYLAIWLVKRFVRQGRLYIFTPYCVAVGLAGIAYYGFLAG